MRQAPYQVLFVCTGNSARSILAEAIANHLIGGHFKAHSAGSRPTGVVNPWALHTLEGWHIPTAGLRSKSWDEFAGPTGAALDFVFTVCDSAAGEACPYWPGQPMTAHWGMLDPAAVAGDDRTKAKAFLDTAIALRRRIELLNALPLASLDRLTLQGRLRDIGAA